MRMVREIFSLVVIAVCIPLLPVFWAIGVFSGIMIRCIVDGYCRTDTLFKEEETTKE